MAVDLANVVYFVGNSGGRGVLQPFFEKTDFFHPNELTRRELEAAAWRSRGIEIVRYLSLRIPDSVELRII